MSDNQILSEIVVITPQQAEIWLRHNNTNRKLSKPLVKRLANAIKRGEWELNGESIKIARGGRLLDGQHRLSAIIEAGKEIKTYVVKNLNAETFHTIDCGKLRSNADMLEIRGEENQTALANLLTKIYFYKRKFSGFRSYGQAPSIQQLEKILQEYPVLRDYLAESQQMPWCKKFITAANYAFCKFLFDLDNRAASIIFFKQLESGANLIEGSPVLYLRERLMQVKANRLQAIQKIELMAYVFKAYKLFRDKKAVKVIRVQRKENLDLIFDLRIGLWGIDLTD